MLDSSVLVGIIRGEPDTGRLLGLLRATNVFSCQAELVEQTAGAGPAEGVPGSDCKRVEEADAGLLEAGVVARDNDQVVDEGRGGDQAVLDRHCAPRGAKTCEQFCPPQARFSFPCQAMKPLNARGDGRSRLVRLFPLRNSKMPNLNSPRIMGSTAYSRSLRRSHSTTLETAPAWSARSTRWRRPDTSQLVGRPGFDGNEETFRGAREQPVHHALIRRRQTPRKAVLAAIEPFDLELLAGFDPVLPPDLDRQHNLAPRGNCGPHVR